MFNEDEPPVGGPDYDTRDQEGREPEVFYPNIVRNLTECKGNAYFAMNRVAKALREHGVSEEEIKIFKNQCGDGLPAKLDFDFVVSQSQQWITVE